MNELIGKCPGLEPIFADALAVSKYLWDKGWAERNAGNLSVDVTERISDGDLDEARRDPISLESAYPVLAGRFFLVTGTGRRFRDLANNAADNTCILRISEDGASYRILWGGGSRADFRPTSEFPTHLRLHERLREDGAPEKVVLHTHPPELIVLTHLPDYKDETALNKALWCIHPEVKYNLPKGVGFVPYALPGSEALAQATAKGFSKGQSVVLWEMHGCVARAKEPMVAFDLIDIAAKAAAMVLMCRSAGHIPTGLTDEHIDELVREFNLEE